jgi:hypothetical protein
MPGVLGPAARPIHLTVRRRERLRQLIPPGTTRGNRGYAVRSTDVTRNSRDRNQPDAANLNDQALPERPEARADFFGKQLRLFPRGEVAAPVGLVEVDDVRVERLDPAARGRKNDHVAERAARPDRG